MDYSTLITKPERDYELIDSGEGEKLERFGSVIVSRPDPQALWKKLLPHAEWSKAGAQFLRQRDRASWRFSLEVPKRWTINFCGLEFMIKPSSFKHTGLFPEQSQNWKWIEHSINKGNNLSQRKISVLNLFGYTGGATLTAAKAGAEVVHVDGSKVALTWARENAELSQLHDKPIRWILDDVKLFIAREIKRKKFYDAIIMDPPAFGHGPQGEIWNIEDDFLELLDMCKAVLAPQPLFFLLNGYASGYSALAYKNALTDLMSQWSGNTEVGELAIQESHGKRLLPSGIFARWNNIAL